MFVSLVEGEVGERLPPGCRDATFLRDALLVALACDERQLTLASDAGLPPTLLYRDSAAPGNAATALAILPIDLARYATAQVQAWTHRYGALRVIVLHERSAAALRQAGFAGHITRLPVLDPPPQPSPTSSSLELTRVFRCIDSRGRPYDPEWLLPDGHSGKQPSAEEPDAAEAAADASGAEASILATPPNAAHQRPGLRFRLGATKRHLLNFIAAWRTPAAAFAGAHPQPSPSAEPLHLAVEGCVFTMVLDEFSEESGWTDAVKAFCHAFRAQPNATLLLVLLSDADEQHARDFDHVLCGLYPFACRLILVQATLTQTDYRALVACTDVYLDNYRRDTLLADLRCFAAAGVVTIGYPPEDEKSAGALIPDHLLRHCRAPACQDFSDDPRFRTDARRLDWESLLAALTSAYACVVAKERREDRRLTRAPLLPAIAQRQQMWRQALQNTSLTEVTA